MKAEDEGLMVPAFAPGFHIIYAYAIDAQAATSTNTGQQSSPLIGNISAYEFLIIDHCINNATT